MAYLHTYFQPNESIFNNVDTTNTMFPSKLVQKDEHLQWICFHWATLCQILYADWYAWECVTMLSTTDGIQ